MRYSAAAFIAFVSARVASAVCQLPLLWLVEAKDGSAWYP